MIHFNDLKSDLPAAISRIAAFLGIAIDPAAFPKIVEYCGFDYMKANAERFAPRGGASWQGGASTFINRGTNGRWREVLSPADIAAYETRAESELGGACAGWLAAGGAVGR
jgi:aryl sulfotransferase